MEKQRDEEAMPWRTNAMKNQWIALGLGVSTRASGEVYFSPRVSKCENGAYLRRKIVSQFTRGLIL